VRLHAADLVRRRSQPFEGFRLLHSFILVAVRGGRERNRLRQRRRQRDAVFPGGFGFSFSRLGFLVYRIDIVRLSIADRDFVVIGMNLAKGQKTVSMITIIDKCSL